ncbi:MAG: tryptophan 7-halogenase [Verrucomicrobia bacterium]|nr:tryptophan 7-halogenase [Verrucomicrobiota bacterium]
MTAEFDLAVVGSGFGGSLMAMIARRLGRSVILLERGKHPRFVIGESSTPLANQILEELADRYDLPRVRPLAKWGPWQRTYPGIGCGLKRGFTFYQHPIGRPFAADPARRDQLLVAASARDEVADTHWYRPDFDQFLAQEAQNLGVEYLDEVALCGLEPGEADLTLTAQKGGKNLRIRCKLVLDASGPRGFIHRALALPEAPLEMSPPTQGLYGHFTDVGKMADLLASRARFDETPPYPVDAAAVHHIFDGGWIWVLRFNNGLTSAGVAATDALARALKLADGTPGWARLLERLPTVREQFATARMQFPLVHAPRLAFATGTVAGRNWALLPSAAGFIDPLLSTGIALNLLGVSRLADVLAGAQDPETIQSRLATYARQTRLELETTARLIGALYATLGDFEVFTALARLYFAAVSFTEINRRLGRAHLAPGYLLCRQPRFAGPMQACCRAATDLFRTAPVAPAARAALLEHLRQTIAPFDLIGLGDARRRNWYPVD